MQLHFQNSQTDDHPQQGLSPCYPLCFANVSERDFEILLRFLYALLNFKRTTEHLCILKAIATTLEYEDVKIITSNFLHRLPLGGIHQHSMQQIMDLSFSYPHYWQQTQHRHFDFQFPPDEIWERIEKLQDVANIVIIPL